MGVPNPSDAGSVNVDLEPTSRNNGHATGKKQGGAEEGIRFFSLCLPAIILEGQTL